MSLQIPSKSRRTSAFQPSPGLSFANTIKHILSETVIKNCLAPKKNCRQHEQHKSSKKKTCRKEGKILSQNKCALTLLRESQGTDAEPK
jgi:hypothetical protein